MTRIKHIDTATKVVALSAFIASFSSWAWKKHNEFLIDLVGPVLRASYVSRINSYRKRECMGDFSAHEDLTQALQDYEDLVGRPIRERDCDSL